MAYLVSEGQSQIVMSKAKVTPLSSRTLPQLELTAMFVGAQLIRYLSETLRVEWADILLWSDSSISVQWVNNNKSDIIYVRNRVAEIRRVRDRFGVKVKWVSTNENPADLLSRGCSFECVQDELLWKRGPDWLVQESEWIADPETPCVSVNEIVSELPQYEVPQPLFDYEKISDLKQILSVTGKVFRFIRKVKGGWDSFKEPLIYWIHYCQARHFGKIKILLTGGRVEGAQDSKVMINQLGLFLDSNGLIRSKGRVGNSELEESACHPLLLSPKEYLTRLIVLKCHVDCMHGGVNQTLNQVRQEFWIPKGRQCVKRVLSSCAPCKRTVGKTYVYPGPPPLPEERVKFSVPFQTVGVDYSGAITLSGDEREVGRKYYICLFTCAATRAIHLELAKDLSAETFLLLFRKFVARRSLPRLMISDNGTYFKSTAKFLLEIALEPSVQDFLGDHSMEWRFVSPRAPWQGGFYERLIGIVKGTLRKMLFKCRISSTQLETTLAEIEAVVNNRPLTYLGTNCGESTALTPSLLIQGRNITLTPPFVEWNPLDVPYLEGNKLVDNYCKLSKVLQHFKTVFHREYITAIREKHYGACAASNRQPIKEGDVVLVETDHFRDFWPLGRIVRVIPGVDGVTRSVEVLVKGKVLIKTIEKLVPLEADIHDLGKGYRPELAEDFLDDDDDDGSSAVDTDPPGEVSTKRPKRQAALRAEDLRARLISNEQL